MNLTRLREKRELTREQLAKKIEASQTIIAHVKHSWRRCYPKLRREIAIILGEPDGKIIQGHVLKPLAVKEEKERR